MTYTNLVRIKISGTDYKLVEEVCGQMKEIAKKNGVEIRGPIPLPTKRLIVPVRKSPDGEGSETWEKWEMRIHRRLIYVDADDRTLMKMFKIPFPEGIHLEVKLLGNIGGR